ncbi:MAG TPA: hypothetical protein VNV66_12490 [Pilimelia sp.]|nr:hypothetical protein [Pilimelia sp.]
MTDPGTVPSAPLAALRRELLVRYLDAWVPTALRHARHACYLDGFATPATATAALQVFGEFADLLARRTLAVRLGARDAARAAALNRAVGAVRDRGGVPTGLTVEVAVRPPGAAPAPPDPVDGPLLGYLDATADAGAGPPTPAELTALLGGDCGEVILVVAGDGAGAEGCRAALAAAGAGLLAAVELVAEDGATETLLFGTDAPRALDAFKDALWAVDEYAGVRYRDPRDADRALLDISLTPHPGPLRRALLAHLHAAGGRTVTQLKRYAVAETIYRATDVTRALTVLLASGAVRREPQRGRLTGEVHITLAR